MNSLKIYCISTNPSHLSIIKKLNYLPVGLGDSLFSNEWITDTKEKNISKKNEFYGEYTFHYWMWKNHIKNLNNDWIGFCQYRKFWSLENLNNSNISFEIFQNSILKEIPSSYEKYETILGEELFINQFRLSKFIKNNLKTMIKNPNLFFDKGKRNIRFHFDMMHGKNNLYKAIELLDSSDRSDFREFVNKNTSFNPHNMFICKSKEILISYYESVFPWLERCEKIFGFKDLDTYGLKRIYAFLAERYMSYWFQKNTKSKTMPIIFKDISSYLNNKK